MAKLYEVRDALKQGDRKTATSLLKQILQDNPSAEAWVIAAQLSSSPETQLKYAKNALRLDKNNRAAADLVRALTPRPSSASAEEDASERSMRPPLFANRGLRLALFGLLTFLIVTGGGLLLLRLTNPPVPIPPTPLPFVAPLLEQYRQTIAATGLTIVNAQELPSPANLSAIQHLQFTVQDIDYSVKPVDYLVSVYLYPTEFDQATLRADEADLTQNAQQNNSEVRLAFNAVLVYPKILSEAARSALDSQFFKVDQQVFTGAGFSVQDLPTATPNAETTAEAGT